MSIIDDDVGSGRPSDPSRPWWFVPALVGVVLGGIVGAAALPAASHPATTSPSPAATRAVTSPVSQVPSRPSDLPLLPQEVAVIRALNGIGVPAEGVGASHFADALGAPLPARVFWIAPVGEADVLFLDSAQRDIRVCPSTGPSGETFYAIYVNGQMTSSSIGGQFTTYLVSSQYFVIAWDARAASTLQLGLGLTPARC